MARSRVDVRSNFWTDMSALLRLLEVDRGLERVAVGHLRVARADLEIAARAGLRRERLHLRARVLNRRRDDAVGERALDHTRFQLAAAPEEEPHHLRRADLALRLAPLELQLHRRPVDL